MRKPLYFALVATTLLVGSAADAQAGGRGRARAPVVVVSHAHTAPSRGYHVAPRRRPTVARVHPSVSVHEERNDLARIAQIRRSWNQAVRTGDRHAERLADRRLQLWIDQELSEVYSGRNRGHRYAAELERAKRELASHQWRFATGRARHPHYAHKARILDRLVQLSERRLFDAKRLGYSGHGVR